MAACTFFGHRECSEEIRPELVRVLTELIEHRGGGYVLCRQSGAV